MPSSTTSAILFTQQSPAISKIK
ncbi:Bgt-51744 [Blumeria graminis f. sp. tritici]|uniref:Bgt-51744 n=1 Tax=Blumeria graminis f. sp. tritici TaxID=62690 RepID=A0A9X9QH45_BLUGR|nr:Bgt-51744 [Blumeria graminis f. sp. tritici]